MALTKNLANCTPKEFLVQANKIRRSAEKWLKLTDIINIRKRVPELNVPKNASPEELDKAMKDNNDKMQEAARSNLSAILDEVMEKHPDETLEILALACFVEPSKVNDHKVTEYLANLSEIMNDKDVLSFFTSLMRLGQTGILSA